MEGKEQVHLQSCFILGLQVLTRDALAAGLAACRTYANMFPPASALRSMPSSLPNGSASVEPTPRWPVVGTLMGGLTLTHIHSLTHSPTSPTSPPTSPTALTHSPTHFTSLHFTHFTHSHIPHSHTPHSHHSLTLSLTHCTWTYIHTHKLTHHHRSITLILPLPFLLFYGQSKSKEVGNMWGYPVLSFRYSQSWIIINQKQTIRFLIFTGICNSSIKSLNPVFDIHWFFFVTNHCN